MADPDDQARTDEGLVGKTDDLPSVSRPGTDDAAAAFMVDSKLAAMYSSASSCPW